MKRHIALLGNPNSGKTSLFNELTGSNQYVGNWPGVTVEQKKGKLISHESIEIIDLPGIYSLSPYSPDEIISYDYLKGGEPDLILNIVDVTNLERNLYLTTQLLEFGLPVIVALNMTDLAEKRGDRIKPEILAQQLGCPVIEISALKRKGLKELKELLSGELPNSTKELRYGAGLEAALKELCAHLRCSRESAFKLLQSDQRALAEFSPNEEHQQMLGELIAHLEAEHKDDIASIIASERYTIVDRIAAMSMEKVYIKQSGSTRIDNFLTHRVFGLAVFAFLMWGIYAISISTVGDWGTAWANDFIFGPVIGGWLQGFIGSTTAPLESLVLFSGLLSMCLLLPTTLRRLHDLGRSGAWLYLPIMSYLMSYAFPAFPEPYHAIILYALYTLNVVMFIALLVLPSSKSGAHYGYAPRFLSKKPLSCGGCANRREYLIYLILISALSFGIAMLGKLNLDCSPQVQSLFTDGIVGGVGAVLGFLPQMAVLFMMLTLLEDCGYMARVAFMMDRIFRTIGLSGKSFIPLLVSMGCGVPGIMATRTIENEKDRRMTIMLTTFMPCGAKLPIIALVGLLLGQSAMVATLAYFVSIGSVIIGGLILRKTKYFQTGYSAFMMELPSYHRPSLGNLNLRAMERCQAFAQKAGSVIIISCMLIWATSNYNFKLDYLEGERIEESMLASVGKLAAPLFAPLGWGDWKPTVASITGLVAKEQIIGTFSVLYAGSSEEAAKVAAEAAALAALASQGALKQPASSDENAAASPSADESSPAALATVEEISPEEEFPRTEMAPKYNVLSGLTMLLWQGTHSILSSPAPIIEAGEEEDESLGIVAELRNAKAFTTLSAFSFLLFNLLCAPCFAACAAIKREMNSTAWTWASILYMCGWAYLCAFLFYQIGSAIQTESFAISTGVALAFLLIIIYRLLRRPDAISNQ